VAAQWLLRRGNAGRRCPAIECEGAVLMGCRALGTDTGGSVRLPAAYTGVVGFKPSYGLLSRWGVIAYANSLDTVGIMGENVDDVEVIFSTSPLSYLSHSNANSRLQTHLTTPTLRIPHPSHHRLARSWGPRNIQSLSESAFPSTIISPPSLPPFADLGSNLYAN
jgi:hypothetical protein